MFENKNQTPLRSYNLQFSIYFLDEIEKKKKKKKTKTKTTDDSFQVVFGRENTVTHSLSFSHRATFLSLSLSLSLSLWNLNLQWIESNWEKNVEVRVPYDVSRRNSSDIERIPNRQHFRERSLQTELRFRFRSLHSTPLPHRLSPRVLFLFIFHSLSILSFLSSIFKIQTKPEKP